MIFDGHKLISPPVWADFNRFDDFDRVKLDCPGTVNALKQYGIVLKKGLRLLLYDVDLDENRLIDDLVAVAVVKSVNQGVWVADIEEGAFRHVSELDANEQRAYRRFRPSVGSPLQ